MSGDFQKWLTEERKVRELRYQLTKAFKKLRSHFSYLRLEGLGHLLGTLKLLTDEDMPRFQLLQQDETLNVIRHVVQLVLSPTLQLLCPPTTLEKLRGLELVAGACLFDPMSRKTFRFLGGIEATIKYLDHSQTAVQIAAVEAIMAVLIDSSDGQQMFIKNKGFEKTALLLFAEKSTQELKERVVEFLFLVGWYYDEYAKETGPGTIDYTQPPPNRCREEIKKVLGGEKTDYLLRSVRWKDKPDLGPQLDVTEFLTYLHSQSASTEL